MTFPLPAAWGIDLYLKDESTHPTGSLKHRLARSLFLYGLCNGWIDEGRHHHRGVVGFDGCERGVFRADARPAVRRSRTGNHLTGEARTHRAVRWPLPRRRRRTVDLCRSGRARGRVRRRVPRSIHLRRARPRTGVATTTSPNRSSSRWRWSVIRCRPGSWSAPAPVEPRPRSAATSAICRSRPGSASSTHRTVSSPTTSSRATGNSRLTTLPGSKGSDASGSSRVSSARSSTAWSASTTRHPSPRCSSPPIASGGRSAGRPAPTCAARSG